MPAKKMLIDATHPEETRVVVLNGKQIENFDVEVNSRRQLKGNIYLARVTRVEPSLQAAFVEYGGNRHGFLAFSEVHPDYYQIPVADREVLLAEQAQEKIESELIEDVEKNAAVIEEAVEANPDGHDAPKEFPDASDDNAQASDDRNVVDGDARTKGGAEVKNIEAAGTNANAEDVTSLNEVEGVPESIETLADEDDTEEPVQRPSMPSRRNYKIQEVIKRRQIILIQVVKEERGNKGAALTTYISLAGRYCVLMPNTARGGGISRKITNGADRKRLKTIVNSLGIPEGMAVIMRTAGIKQTKPQIKRDYDYLLRLWSTVRELTLISIAPTLVYEEGNLIKRSIRDLYNKDIDEIIVEGEASYRMAKDFMKMFIPSHAKRVQPYSDSIMPLMHRYQVEGQLDAMHSPEVKLKSGGYIVINPTEALVAIDVNSGRSTKERNIEETAYKTNLEAAEEIARQLRLRDLSGLIVIDFIDMEINKNNAQVERRLKDFMRGDRARIQIGRISGFGLLELSRQRLRPSIIESTSEVCLHCEGTGIRRSTESTALNILRAIEEEGTRKRLGAISVYVPTSVALYILNQKRQMLAEIEARYEFSVTLESDDTLIPPNHRIERTQSGVARPSTQTQPTSPQSIQPTSQAGDGKQLIPGDEEAPRKRRRRSRSRRKSNQDGNTETTNPNVNAQTNEAPAASAESEEMGSGTQSPASLNSEQGENAPKRRRRGRRGGRKRRPLDEEGNPIPAVLAEGQSTDNSTATPAGETSKKEPKSSEELSLAVNNDGTEKNPRRGRRRTTRKSMDSPQQVSTETTVTPAPIIPAVIATPVTRVAQKALESASESATATPNANVVNADEKSEGGKEGSAPKRRGWWQRLTE